MKNNMIVLLIMILFFSLFACTTKKDDTILINIDNIEGIYEKNEIEYDNNILKNSELVLYEKKIFFCGTIYNNDKIENIIANIDLETYNIDYINLDIPYSVLSFVVNNENYIFLLSNYNTLDFSQEYYIIITDYYGNIIKNESINDILNINDTNNSFILKANNDNIFISNEDIIYKFDMNLNKINYYQLDYNVNSFGSISNENLLIYCYDDNYKSISYTINIELDKIIKNNFSINDIGSKNNIPFYYDNEYNIYFKNDINIIKYNINSNKYYSLINWVNSGISFNNIESIIAVDDNFLIYGYDILSEKFGFWLLKPILQSDIIKEKTIIKITYIEDGNYTIPNAAIKFNNSQKKYHIICDEYFLRNVDNDDLFNSFDIDIMNNNVGDIIVLNSNIDYTKYANKNAFVDFYDIIKSDPYYSINDLYDCIKSPYEINNSLYVLIPEFTISTYIGNQKNLQYSNWTVDNVINILTNLPEDKYFLETTSKESICKYFINTILNDYIDYDSFSCDFINNDFINLLEIMNSFPNENKLETVDNLQYSYYKNNVYLYPNTIGGFCDYIILQSRFGFDNEIDIVGFPTNSGSSHKINPSKYYTISSYSNQKEGAWEFIKYLLSDEIIVNKSIGMRFIPSSRNTFTKWIEYEKRFYYYFPKDFEYYYITLLPLTDNVSLGDYIKLSDETISNFENFIININIIKDAPSEIINILSEELEIFFTGNINATQIANIIQNRVNLYLNEKNTYN